jgi:hypothetical protein
MRRARFRTTCQASTRCEPRAPRRVTKRLVHATAVAIVAVSLAPVGSALAAGPTVTIESPANGSYTNNQTPTFSGRFEESPELQESNEVTVRIYREGEEVQQLPTVTFQGPTWSAGPATTLPPGTYTAQARGWSDELLEAGTPSNPVTFTVDTTPPQVTLTSPANGSSTSATAQVVSGSAGTAPGDRSAISVQVFAGATVGSQPPLETVGVSAQGGAWSTTLGLVPGTYTVRAQQSDEAGNTGVSAAVSFTVTSPPAPPPPAPPAASFKWFPTVPATGEHVSLVSTSTDSTSPITGYAWALTSKAAFTDGKATLTTSFATPGDQVVRLRVTAADGLSSIVTDTIHVVRPPLKLMEPFPIVRIAGVLTASGVRLSVLSAQAPVGARVTVTCRGRGCPTASESRVAASSRKKHRATVVVISFRRFERSLWAGVVLQVRIFRPGRIGKYTRFVIRHHGLPERVDECLGPAGRTPISCPTS